LQIILEENKVPHEILSYTKYKEGSFSHIKMFLSSDCSLANLDAEVQNLPKKLKFLYLRKFFPKIFPSYFFTNHRPTLFQAKTQVKTCIMDDLFLFLLSDMIWPSAV
jgi:hypothetical protein